MNGDKSILSEIKISNILTKNRDWAFFPHKVRKIIKGFNEDIQIRKSALALTLQLQMTVRLVNPWRFSMKGGGMWIFFLLLAGLLLGFLLTVQMGLAVVLAEFARAFTMVIVLAVVWALITRLFFGKSPGEMQKNYK